MYRRAYFIELICATIAVALIAIVLGCGEYRTPVAPAGRVAMTPAEQQRIVSFSPAMTQIIVDLGRGAKIVAVGAFDPIAPAGSAIVGDFLRVDYERLIEVNPTDIFIQATRQPLPARLLELAKERGWKLHLWEIETRGDVAGIIAQEAGAAGLSISSVLGLEERGSELVKKMDAQLAALARVTASEPRTAALLIVGRSPVTAAGSRTFLSELLTIAGGENVIADLNTLYPALDRERLMALRPDCVILIRPRMGAAATQDEAAAPVSAELPDMQGARVEILDDPASLLPSSSMPRVAAELARRLHPKLKAQIDAVMDVVADAKK